MRNGRGVGCDTGLEYLVDRGVIQQLVVNLVERGAKAFVVFPRQGKPCCHRVTAEALHQTRMLRIHCSQCIAQMQSGN